jgi:hypothetical protein
MKRIANHAVALFSLLCIFCQRRHAEHGLERGWHHIWFGRERMVPGP